ncbi:MAG: diacylglycerol kinase family lipid kinase, partial [Verrucomicrobia bacterium]|nr:diacylglycerol kinase family lipid kinase [Verrucomicrobiota bacterium]
FHLLRRYPKLTLLLTVDGQQLNRRSPFLFVGNNEYELAGFALGERRVLDGGHLGLYVTPRTGRFDLYWLLLRAFFGRLERRRDFEFFRATEATVEMSRPDVLVATDGEVARMKAPLNFRTRPGALQVMVPRDDEGK